MQIQHQPTLLHRSKDLVVILVVLDSSVRVGGHSSRIALDSSDACSRRFLDLGRGDGRVEVESHEEGGLGGEGLEVGLVGEGVGGGDDGRGEVGLNERERERKGELAFLLCSDLFVRSNYMTENRRALYASSRL